VGYSNCSAETRIGDWQKKSREKYTLLAEFPTKFPKYLEHMVHEYFKSKRVVYTDPRGKERIEWFLVAS
jgi:hypothetical protein